MQRRDFKGWGIELDDDAFAEAVAGAGVLSALHATVGFKDPRSARLAELLHRVDTRTDPLPWKDPRNETWSLPRAEILGEAWRGLQLQSSPRFEVQEWGSGSPVWLVQQLARKQVGASGVYLRVDTPQVDVAWEWPIRIGLIDDDRSRRFGGRFDRIVQGSSWLPNLVSLVDLTRAPHDCDLLLLPHDLRRAVAVAASAPFTIRADCTLVLGRAADDARLMGLIAGLRSVVRTSGVGLVHLRGKRTSKDDDNQMSWLKEMLRELTHNATLDVALLRAHRGFESQSSAPVLAGSRQLLAFRLAMQVRRMSERFRVAAKEADAPIDIASGSAFERTFNMSGVQPMSEVANKLDNAATEDWYFSEGSVASAAAEMMSASKAVPTRVEESRFLQVQAFEIVDEVKLLERHRALRPNASHRINVRFAALAPDWISETRAFPVEELPADQPDYRLTVVLTDTSYRHQPQVEWVVLPAVGPSSVASFYVRTAAEGSMEWRVAVLHANRVLQTALLQAPVAEEDTSDVGITFALVAHVRPTFEDLNARTSFDAALVLNHNSLGQPGIVSIEDESARSFPIDKDMATVVDWFDDHLSTVAKQRSTYDKGLDSPESLDLLRLFAQQGRQLYGHIVTEGIGDGGLARGDRLHVVLANASARLPLEFVYDRIGPRDDATLCTVGLQALRDAAETGSLARPAACSHDEDDDTIVCPMSFWGVQKVIERHRYDPLLAVAPQTATLRAEPARDRKPLDILRSGIVGGNYRVDAAVPNGTKSVCERLATATTVPTEPVSKWEEWTTAVAARQPSLLIAIVHNEKKLNTTWSQMEIGRDSWVDVNGFNRQYLRSDKNAPEPVLLLLACESGSPEVGFNSFIAKARQEGVAMVIAAGAQIHAAHAVTVSCELIDALRSQIATAASRGSQLTFGDVFLNVRRALLAKGLLMVLTLETYGDADWKLQAAN